MVSKLWQVDLPLLTCTDNEVAAWQCSHILCTILVNATFDGNLARERDYKHQQAAPPFSTLTGFATLGRCCAMHSGGSHAIVQFIADRRIHVVAETVMLSKASHVGPVHCMCFSRSGRLKTPFPARPPQASSASTTTGRSATATSCSSCRPSTSAPGAPLSRHTSTQLPSTLSLCQLQWEQCPLTLCTTFPPSS